MEVKNSKQENEVMLEAVHITFEKFAEMVKDMREKQTEYFKTRSTEMLREAKIAEHKVDKYIKTYETPALIFNDKEEE